MRTEITKSSEEVLSKDNSVTVFHKRLELLATEMFKVRSDLALQIMKEVFQFNNPTFCMNTFLRRNIRKTYHKLISIQYLALKILELIPGNMKTCNSLRSFKQLITIWVPNRCICRLCNARIAEVGFTLWACTKWVQNYVFLFTCLHFYSIYFMIFLLVDFN